MSVAIDAVQSLKAGPSLDELVAENVMGWARHTHDGRDYWCWPDGRQCRRQGGVDAFRPSADLYTTMLVLESIGDRITLDRAGRPCGMTVTRASGRRWEVWLTCDEMGPIRSVWAETFPLAACRAAVAAAGRA